MEIILTAMEGVLAEAWQKHCGDLEMVHLHEGSILELQCDSVVSPANSFGFMDGGIALAYSHHFGWGVQQSLQKRIRTRHHGELLVGKPRWSRRTTRASPTSSRLRPCACR